MVSAQNSFYEWNGKAAQAKSEYEANSAKSKTLMSELETLMGRINSATIAVAQKTSELKGIEEQLTQRKTQLEQLKEQVSQLSSRQNELEENILTLSKSRRQAEMMRSEAETAKNDALDQKRKAESMRDKAIAEKVQAEEMRAEAQSSYEKRKREIDELFKELEGLQVLKTRKASVNGGDEALDSL